IQVLVWDYMDEKANEGWAVTDEPSAELIVKEINGYTWPAGSEHPVRDGKPLPTFGDLKDDGTTTSGAWIYTGIYNDGKHQAANGKGGDWVAPGWGFPWPANRRIMYNRCSADPRGNPWPKEARLVRQYAGQLGASSPWHRGYVYWDAAADSGKGRWV